MKLNIAIVGAGVSGIILGSLLKKYLNVNISIFEKRINYLIILMGYN